MELDGGGFEAMSSLRLGLFYSDSAGTLSDTSWKGSDAHDNGYLFIPPSGSNAMSTWNGTAGSSGAVLNGTWYNTDDANNYVLGNTPQQPAGAVGGADTYNFSFSVQAKANGSNEIRYLIEKDGYHFGGILMDNHSPVATNKFNGINFAIDNNTTTALKLTDVYVDMGTPLDSSKVVAVEQNNNNLPTQFALDQNYPNPFNPTTTIQFALPKTSNVHLVVYNILGQVVANLADGNYNAGYYKINFDASNLASGIYFYSLKAGDFVSVKKLMLLK